MILRERPKTPGRVGPDGELVEEEPNPAAALRSLPNATERRTGSVVPREERAGNLDQAMSFIEQGIKRHAEPNEELVAAREALAAKMEFAELEPPRRSPRRTRSETWTTRAPSSPRREAAPLHARVRREDRVIDR